MTFQVVYETHYGGVLAWDAAFPDAVRDQIEPEFSVATINDDDRLMHWLDTNVVWPPYALLKPDGQTLTIVRTWPGGADAAAIAQRDLINAFLGKMPSSPKVMEAMMGSHRLRIWLKRRSASA